MLRLLQQVVVFNKTGFESAVKALKQSRIHPGMNRVTEE